MQSTKQIHIMARGAGAPWGAEPLGYHGWNMAIYEPVLTHQNIRGVTEGMIPSVDAFDKELCDKRKDFKQFLVLEK